MPKKISHIVLLGEFHRDPAPIYIIRSLLSQAVDRKQPVIFADEEDPRSTIEGKLVGNIRFTRVNEALFDRFNLQPLLSNDLYRPYFKLADRKKLFDALSGSVLAQEHVDGLMRHAVFPERIALWQHLKATGIRNISFDADETIRAIARQGDECFSRVEAVRIEQMARNIIRSSRVDLPDGGMMIVSGGINHSVNLLAALKTMYAAMDPSDHLIIFQSFRLCSPYAFESIPNHEKDLHMLKGCLPKAILAQYNPKESPLELCAENPSDGAFTSPLAERLGVNFYSFYTIPDCSEEKKAQITALFGQIISENPDGSVTARLHSTYLLAPIRESLGIDRRRLKFKLDADIEVRFEYLREQCSGVTIEYESEQTYLLTFPQSAETLEHLTTISSEDKWQDHIEAHRRFSMGSA